MIAAKWRLTLTGVNNPGKKSQGTTHRQLTHVIYMVPCNKKNRLHKKEYGVNAPDRADRYPGGICQPILLRL